MKRVLVVGGERFRWSKTRKAWVRRHGVYMVGLERLRPRAWFAWFGSPARGMMHVAHGRGAAEALAHLDRELCAVLDVVLRYAAIRLDALRVPS